MFTRGSNFDANHLSKWVSFGCKSTVDADYRDDTYLATLKSDALHVLSLHEAEAYLCMPEILCAIAGRIGSQEMPLTNEDVQKRIIEALNSRKLTIAAKRAFSRSHITLGVSVAKRVFSTATNKVDLLAAIRTAAEDELQKANNAVSADQVEANFNEEIQRIEDAISTGCIETALRLLPAKELLNTLASRAGCKDAFALMRSLRHNFKPDDFPITKSLSAVLRKNGS